MAISKISNTNAIDAGAVNQAALASGVAGTGPAFSAYPSTVQSLSSGVYTKVQLNAEEFDTNNCFDSTTNYRFTPNVAGYYSVQWQAAIYGSNQTIVYSQVYKNGSRVKSGFYQYNVTTNSLTVGGSALIYCNGTTDYLEMYVYTNAANSIDNTAIASYFSGFLARAA